MIDPLTRTVLQLMARFGGDAELVITGEPVYDPETSTVVSEEYSTPIRVLVFDYLPKTGGIGTQAGTLIQAGDKQVFIKPADDVPQPQAKVHSILFKGKKYSIVDVKDHDTSGTNPLVYEVYARE